MNNENDQTADDIEVRIIAMLLGETSDFESAQINEMLERDPELQKRHDELENIHQSMVEIGKGEFFPSDTQWKLNSESRSSLLAVLDGDPLNPVSSPNANSRSTSTHHVKKTNRISLLQRVLYSSKTTAIASAACVLILLGASLLTASFSVSNHQFATRLSEQADSKANSNWRRSSASESSEPKIGAVNSPNGFRRDLEDSAKVYFGRAPEEKSIIGRERFDLAPKPPSASRPPLPNAPADSGNRISGQGLAGRKSSSDDKPQPALKDLAILENSRNGQTNNFNGRFNDFSRGRGQQDRITGMTGSNSRTGEGVLSTEDSDSGGFRQTDQGRGGQYGKDLDTADSTTESSKESLGELSTGRIRSYGGGRGGLGGGGFGGGGLGGGGFGGGGLGGGQMFGGGGDLGGARGGRGGYLGEGMTGDSARSFSENASTSTNADGKYFYSESEESKLEELQRSESGLGISNGLFDLARQQSQPGQSQSQQGQSFSFGLSSNPQYSSEELSDDDTEDYESAAIDFEFGPSRLTSPPEFQSQKQSERSRIPSANERTPGSGTVLLGGIRRTRDRATVPFTPPKKWSESSSRADRSIQPIDGKRGIASGLNETVTDTQPFSTFSLHVSDVAFKLAQESLFQGKWPDADRVRVEEFVNAFDYNDPLPTTDEKVACQLEQAIHPFLPQRNVMRVAMRTSATGRANATPLNLTLLLDNSGSMERPDRRVNTVKAIEALSNQLRPTDNVTLISFANQPRLLADKVSGDQQKQLIQQINNLPSEGGTNIESALKLAQEKSLEQNQSNAQNRIVLLTDGAVNLGDADPNNLAKIVTNMRNEGVAFDAAGISARDLNDDVLEALTRQGDGRYYVINSADDADSGFAQQIAGALRPSAKNVKVQIEFNRDRVPRFKLLGFEKHRLKTEDFKNDAVDAAELAAAESGVALYQFEIDPNGSGDVGSVSVRFQDIETGRMVEKRWPIPYQPDAPRIESASPSLKTATAAAMFAARLKGDALGLRVQLKQIKNWLTSLDPQGKNIAQLQKMVEAAEQIDPSSSN